MTVKVRGALPVDSPCARYTGDKPETVLLKKGSSVYREIITENIDHDILLVDMPYDHDRLEKVLGLLVETVYSKAGFSCIFRKNLL